MEVQQPVAAVQGLAIPSIAGRRREGEEGQGGREACLNLTDRHEPHSSSVALRQAAVVRPQAQAPSVKGKFLGRCGMLRHASALLVLRGLGFPMPPSLSGHGTHQPTNRRA